MDLEKYFAKSDLIPAVVQEKSTGEVLGVGKNLREALFKGLISAGYHVEKHSRSQEEQAAADLAGKCQASHGGVLISVNKRDQPEIVDVARRLTDPTSTVSGSEMGESFSFATHFCFCISTGFTQINTI